MKKFPEFPITFMYYTKQGNILKKINIIIKNTFYILTEKKNQDS